MYKLLIVEDDFIIAKGLQKHFEKYHYDVQYIEDFEHVLDDFLEFQPDLVLLDIHLPFFDGYYWCQEISENNPMIYNLFVKHKDKIYLSLCFILCISFCRYLM